MHWQVQEQRHLPLHVVTVTWHNLPRGEKHGRRGAPGAANFDQSENEFAEHLFSKCHYFGFWLLVFLTTSPNNGYLALFCWVFRILTLELFRQRDGTIIVIAWIFKYIKDNAPVGACLLDFALHFLLFCLLLTISNQDNNNTDSKNEGNSRSILGI